MTPDQREAWSAHEAQYEAFLRAKRYCKGDPLSEAWRREMSRLNASARAVVDSFDGRLPTDLPAMRGEGFREGRNTLRDVRKGRAGR